MDYCQRSLKAEFKKFPGVSIQFLSRTIGEITKVQSTRALVSPDTAYFNVAVMTDSGFSSAASNRSSSAIVRPSLLNSLNSQTTNPTNSKRFVKEPAGVSSTTTQSGLPKPSAFFPTSGSKASASNRFVFPKKSHGGYSPSLYSPKEVSPMHMSPMSSLAYDFRDLNTSRDVADTPRKRLSLSSASSLDSPCLIQPSPAALSFASSLNSPQVMQDDGLKLSPQIRQPRPRKGFVDTRTSRKQIFRPLSFDAKEKPKSCLDNTKSGNSDETLVEMTSEQGSNVEVSMETESGPYNDSVFKPICEKEGCFTDTPSPIDLSDMQAKFDQRALQEKDANTLHGSACGDGKLNKYRRFKSMPASSQRTLRNLCWSNDSAGKENSPILSHSKQTHSKRFGSVDSPSPMSGKPSLSTPSPFLSMFARRHSAFQTSPSMTSSPLAFASSSSSAFSSVSQGSANVNLQREAERKIQTKKEEERIREDAEKKLRDAKSPINGSLTPEKSKVPGSISSLSVRTARLSRPASAAPFYESWSSEVGRISPISVRCSKRSLDASNTSLICSPKRHKRSSTLVKELSSTRRKMAFSSKERKSKSAEGPIVHSSPAENLTASFRPISAPPQFLSSDDDEPLSHSRLCSSNDPDSDGDDAMMTSSDLSQRDIDEQLLEEILNENKLARRNGTNEETPGKERTTAATPDGIDGLISAPLLLSASVKETDESFHVERVPKPRELFRSPSAPPVVPSRRSQLAIKRAKQKQEVGTPVGIRRRQTTDFHDIPALLEDTSHEMEEEQNTSLNRSRSYNELDIMKAVDLGCSNDNLIGDFTRVCSLNTVSGKCQDLKYITPQTLIELIENKHDVGCFEIIDCRYPYEHEGGHVVGANCLWEEEALFKRFLNNPKPMWAAGQNNGTYKSPVLVFYCEFSSERGPRMARALRSRDRCVNRYPHLHYPEIYILLNGYKNFFFTEGTRVRELELNSVNQQATVPWCTLILPVSCVFAELNARPGLERRARAEITIGERGFDQQNPHLWLTSSLRRNSAFESRPKKEDSSVSSFDQYPRGGYETDRPYSRQGGDEGIHGH